MKIGVYVLDDLIPSYGGTFSYYSKLIKSIDSYAFKPPLEICYVGRVKTPKNKLRGQYIQLSTQRTHNFFLLLRRLQIMRVLIFIFGRKCDRSNARDIEILEDNRVDVIFYPKQFSPLVDSFPFLTVNWDIAHKSTFMFPEFTSSIDYRENWYRTQLQKALGIIVESEAGKKEAIDYLLIEKSKVDVVPLFAGGVIDLNVPPATQAEFLSKYGLQRLTYFFYPARFWAHKNHYTLIIAFKKFLEYNPSNEIKLIFTGDDGGNKEHIRQTIRDLHLEDMVIDLGFVNDELLYTLYKNSIALVMPSFLGPTNMPILEALALHVPVVCSDLKGHREICHDAALYANPVEPLQWVTAMRAVCADRKVYSEKVADVYARSPFKIDNALKCLESVLLKYSSVRKVFR